MESNRVGTPRPASTRRLSLLIVVVLSLDGACAVRKGIVHASLMAAAEREDPIAVSDALESVIGVGQDTLADRQYAYDVVLAHPQDTAAGTFACATVTGRLVQSKGLRAASLVPEIERCARRSRELDPNFRAGAATRLLGTLYVIAPAALLKHGDSELGVELLEQLVQTHPEGLENHLRLAEAYVALGDPGPAAPHLCECLAHRSALRGDDQILLRQLMASARLPSCSAPTASGAVLPGGRGTGSTTRPEAP